MANPAAYPENGPNRLAREYPESTFVMHGSGMQISLPEDTPKSVLIPNEEVIVVEPPTPGDPFDIPRLGLHGRFELPGSLEKLGRIGHIAIIPKDE